MGLPDPRVGRKESTRTAADRAGSYPARPADRLSSREVKSVSEYLYSSSRHCLPLTISPSPAMEDAGDVLKFEELDDALDDWGNIEEIKEGRDCTFGKIYGPIRALFASDLPLLEKFGECKGHRERLEFLLNMQVVKNSMSDIVLLHPRPEEVPEPTEERREQRRLAPTLTHGANKRFPHLSKAIEVKSSKTEGRYMSAKQKILPGEVLVVEPALSTSLFREYYPSHCLHCFRRLEEKQQDCPGCPTVHFCSTLCLRLGWPLHQWECGVLDYVDSSDIGHMATVAYRLLAAQTYDFFHSNIESLPTKEATYGDGDYMAAYQQESNEEARPSGDHLKRCVTGLVLARCLQLSSWFPESQQQSLDSEEVLNITAILVKHVQAAACNAYEINEMVKAGSSMIDCHSAELGGAVYPTISLSNHACTSNTSRTVFGTTGVLRAIRTIFPNEKIHDNYGYFYHVEERDSRKKMLGAQYFFECNCTACKEDWPPYKVLSRRDPLYYCIYCSTCVGSDLEKVKKCPKCKKDLKPMLKVARRIQEVQKDFRIIMDSITEDNADTNIKMFSGLLQEVEKVCRPPCRELIVCQQVLLQCYTQQGNTFKIEIPPEEAQLVPFTGNNNQSDSEDDSDEDFDMPGLI